MFLDHELKNIQEAKNHLAICCDLRRCLVQVEVQNVRRGVRRTFSNLNLGLVVAKQILGFMHDRQG